MVSFAPILIVDDDAGFRETLSGVFEPRGFDVLQAENGEAALDIVRKTAVSIGLFDFHMPRLTGLETIRQIRQIQPLLPCVLLSAALDDTIRSEAGQLRADSEIPLHVLAKPIQLRQILALVMDTVASPSTSVSIDCKKNYGDIRTSRD